MAASPTTSGCKLNWIDSEIFEREDTVQYLEGVHGILVPGGFGERGAEGKIQAARFAREHKVPYFGICFGMQMAVIEAARNLAGIPAADSTEFGPTAEPVVGLMTEWIHGNAVERRNEGGDLGGTMRLGAYDCHIAPGSQLHDIYGRDWISERHRHRYEVNINYKERLEAVGLQLLRHVARRRAARDGRAAGPSLVHRRAVPSRAEVEALRPAPAVHLLHRGGGPRSRGWCSVPKQGGSGSRPKRFRHGPRHSRIRGNAREHGFGPMGAMHLQHSSRRQPGKTSAINRP